jgi:phenylalanyl-tRNA synthetase alpha subunit
MKCTIFLDWYKVSKLNQDQIKDLNSAIIHKENSLSTPPPQKKSPGPDEFSAEFYKTFKEDLTQILLKLFYKIDTEDTITNSFYDATITLISKLHKERELHTNFLHVYWCKNIQ